MRRLLLAFVIAVELAAFSWEGIQWYKKDSAREFKACCWCGERTYLGFHSSIPQHNGMDYDPRSGVRGKDYELPIHWGCKPRHDKWAEELDGIAKQHLEMLHKRRLVEACQLFHEGGVL